MKEAETNVIISVERKYGGAGAVDVTFVATDGTAVGGDDFDSVVDTLSWADGEQGVKTIAVPIHQDALVEGNETVTLQLIVPGSLASSVARETATLVIVDDDGTLPMSTTTAYLRSLVGTTNYVVTNTTSLFTVDGTVTTYTNLSTTAADELFYMQDGGNGIAVLFRGGTNQFMPQAGDRLRVTAPLTNLNGLLALAPNSANITNVVWRLSSGNALPATAALDFAARTNVNMMEATEAAYVSAGNVWISQVGGGTFPTVATNILLTNQSGMLFNLALNPNTDIGGKPIPAGAVTIQGVLTQNDPTAPYTTNYALLPTRYADIVNSNAVLSFAVANVWVSEAGSVATLSVTRNNSSSEAVTVNFATTNGTAFAGSDYVATNGVLTWAAGDMTSKAISITLLDDAVQEPDETFFVTISAPTGGAGLSGAAATINVVNDDYYIQPASQTNVPHSTASFAITPAASVVAMQWYKGGVAIPGATGPVLYFANVSPTNVGSYTVAITNVVGVVTTPAATLTVPPWAGIISPVEGTTFTAPTNIIINAEAYDPSGAITQVKLLRGTNPLATLTSAPYSFVWTNAPVGFHTLKAVATGHAGLGITSAPVSITVQTALPQIALVSPTNGHSAIAPANVVLSAIASDADNSIARVDFYAKATSDPSPVFVGSVTNLPYLHNWNQITPGQYQLTARAVDLHGPVVTSTNPVTVNILRPATFQFSTNQYFVNQTNGFVKVTVTNSGDFSGVISYQTTNGTAQGGTGFSGDYTIAGNSLALGSHKSTNIQIQIINNYLDREDIHFGVKLLDPGLGGLLGSPATATVTIHQQSNGAATNSLLSATFPTNVPPLNGQLIVNCTPPEAGGQWRFAWDQGWRTNGQAVSNLAGGSYQLEFRTTPGYVPYPPYLTVTVTNNSLTQITNPYYFVGVLGSGSLTVTAGTNPPGGAGWRFIGDTTWRTLGTIVTNLVPDTYYVEFAAVSGWSKPGSRGVLVPSGANVEIAGDYLVPQTPPASVAVTNNVPVPAGSLTNYAAYPFGFVGQLQTDVGYGSGVAVRPNVVLTAAHLIFDDEKLAYANQAFWSAQHGTNANQPAPLPARGWYVLSGYASTRTNDITSGNYGPGESSPSSRNSDVAALYFLTPAARLGFSGYLTSDASPNPYLAGSDLKLLAGYPVDGTLFGDASIVPGQMYQTIPRNDPLNLAPEPVTDQRVHVAPWFLGYSGSSGGPLFVQANGYYYPAAVYLGTLYSGGQPYASAVRAIDSTVVNMINLASSGGDSGTNNNGGGVITLVSQGGSSGLAFLRVNQGPPEALAAGGGWRVQTNSPSAPWNSLSNIMSVYAAEQTVAIEFKPIAHWNQPANQVVTVSLSHITELIATYTPAPPGFAASPVQGLAFSGAAGGPFTPASQTYTLTNTGGGTLNWTVRADQNWVTASPTNGQNNGSVTVSVNSNANSFSNGLYYATLTFDASETNVVTRQVQLTVASQAATNSSIVLEAVPAAGGKITGGGTFLTGSTRTVTATANTGFTFLGWEEFGSVVSAAASYTFTLNNNRSLVARFADVAKPTLTITAPTLNQRWSNSVFTATGKVTDNQTNGAVWYQLNGGTWTNATGWSNWNAIVNLTPGTNSFKGYARDEAGNSSLTNSVNFIYVLTAPISVNIVGNGKVTGATNGQRFEIGKSIAPTATPGTGYVLTNWLVQVEGNTIRSTNKAVPFLMQSNLTLTATFADVAKPTLTITSPTLNQRWSNSVFTATGKVTDNNPNGSVSYQLNGGIWTNANGWSNWSATLNLTPGTNSLKAYARDEAGNRSLTNSVNFIYVLTAPITVNLVGNGKVIGATNGQRFEIGRSTAPTATPGTGYVLTNWLVQVEGNTIRSTNKAVPFLMQSNLVLTATFADVAKPTLTITSPTLNQRWSNSVFTATGKVTDNNPNGTVWYQLNGGIWTNANGWSNWNTTLALTPGTNNVKAYALDAASNRSTTNSVNFIYVLTAPITVNLVGNGKVIGATNGQRFEIGRSTAPTATPGTGYVLTNWLVQVNGDTIRSTNKAVPFLMQSNLTLTATFADIAKPTLTITSPTLNQRWSNSVFTAMGKVTDNYTNGSVWYQFNGGAWTNATGWSNWNAIVNLTPGTNTLKAYALDAAGNRSLSNSVNFIYVLTAPISVNLVGNGKVTGASNGQRFEIGKSIAPTATPGTGYVLTNWLVQVEGNTIRSTNKAVPFLMQSNLTLTATFADVAKPTLTITSPTLNQRWSNSVFTATGKVADNNPNGTVWYQLNGGAWTNANGWSNWNAIVNLTPGTNSLKAYALDAAGNRSTTNTSSVIYVLTYCLAEYYHPTGDGTRLIYDGLDWDGQPAQLKVEINDTNYPLTMYSGTKVISNYVRNVIRIESAYGIYNAATDEFFDSDSWDDYFISEGCSFGFMGSDDSPESIRVDRGFVITNRMAVGQVISVTRNLYTNGVYVGSGKLQLQLMDISNVTVPAGTFADCLRIRMTLTFGGGSQSHDDWLAPSLGMVKQQGVSGDGAPEHWELILAELPSSPRPRFAEQTTTPVAQPLQFKAAHAGLLAPGQPLTLRLEGPAGTTVVIESSADLIHWAPISTNTLSADGLTLPVPVDVQKPGQFFRARLP